MDFFNEALYSTNVRITKPDASLFQVPPRGDPLTLPPATTGISPDLYNAALNVKVPITIAFLYAVTVTFLNAYNKSTGYKAWSISRTKAFFVFVVLHNVFLAVYSGWTFVGMFKGLKRSLESPLAPAGLAGFADSLCKIHGPRGLGNAITYNTSTSAWGSNSAPVLLTSAGTPDNTDVGRLWNEGLAFYGWFFYLSKFYEVLDTLIILVKGKRSSTLQTYHHAGAMFCMWAGIRYMAPPIWLFVFLNSAIHALMYTYYTLTAFAVPIPVSLKRSLTTMQIMQFLIGASYAALHSFISYLVPVEVADIQTVVTTVEAASPTGGSSWWPYILGTLSQANVASPEQKPVQNMVTSHTEYQQVTCINTSGQTFAIWLNVVYLTPLTFLFVRFFIKSYLRRGELLAARQKALKGKVPNGNGHVANGKTR